MIRAVLFDLDGTLADTEEAHRVAFNNAFERYKLGWKWSQDAYRELLKTTGAGVHLCRLSSAAGVELVRRAKAEGLHVTCDVSINSLHLIDEALTPDSSRFWPAADWHAGSNPPSYDKQYLRDWLEQAQVDGEPWPKTPPAPTRAPTILVK